MAVSAVTALIQPARRPGWLAQWRKILDAGVDAIFEVLTSPSPRAGKLRPNRPLAGVLDEQERQAALAAFRCASYFSYVFRALPSPKNVGAHCPTKIPQRSARSIPADSVFFDVHQETTDSPMLTNAAV